jgi:hypothetical protein
MGPELQEIKNVSETQNWSQILPKPQKIPPKTQKGA